MPNTENDDQEIVLLVARLLPDPGLRLPCLRIFAAAIRVAHAISPDLWGVTPYTDCIRFVAGGLVACTLHKGRIWVALAEEGYDATAQAALAAAPGWDPTPLEKYDAISVITGYYTPAVAKPGPEEKVIRSLNAAFIKQVAGKWRHLRLSSQRAHSRAVLCYLNRALGEDLREPAYAPKSNC